MNNAPSQHSHTFDRIAHLLSGDRTDAPPDRHERTHAAVAMILHQSDSDIEVLFIQRASHDLDPWSGHIAFPGGKLEDGERECQAACRETAEEIGIDLEEGRYLGRLSDIVGANLPVRVSCCLFALDRSRCIPALNDEVRDLFWVTLSELSDPERHGQSMVAFDDRQFAVPAIRLPVDNKPVLWGITYRLVMQFLEIISSETAGAEHARLPGQVMIDEAVEQERE